MRSLSAPGSSFGGLQPKHGNGMLGPFVLPPPELHSASHPSPCHPSSLSSSPPIPLPFTPSLSLSLPILLPISPHPSPYHPPSLSLSPPIPLLITPHLSPYHPPFSPYHPTSLFYHFPPHLFSIPCRAMRQSQPCSRAPITARPKGDQCN